MDTQDCIKAKNALHLKDLHGHQVFVGAKQLKKALRDGRAWQVFLAKNADFEQLTSYTTKDPTASAENKWYTYVSLEEFRRMCDSDELLTSTMYAGHGYGSKRCDIDNILAGGKHVLTTMDICGAMSLKTYYKNVTTIYIKREKKALMASILRKNSTIEDKVNRLASIDYDVQNAALCDYIIDFDDYDDAVAQLSQILGK